MNRELDLYDHLKRAQRSTEILLKICIGRLWIQRFKIKFQNYWIHKILTQYFFTLDIFRLCFIPFTRLVYCLLEQTLILRYIGDIKCLLINKEN